MRKDELADMAGVGVATVRRMEGENNDLRLSTANKLADALRFRMEWLLTGDSGVMLLPVHMTMAEHLKYRPPEDSGHPDTVLIVAPGSWYRDSPMAWQVDRQS